MQNPPQLLRGDAFRHGSAGRFDIDDGICEGDLVIVQQQVAPNNGDTVVTVGHGEATIKRFHGAAHRRMRDPLHQRRALPAVRQRRNGVAVIRVGPFHPATDDGVAVRATCRRRRSATTPAAEATGRMNGDEPLV
jgi:hypothetical protein